MKSRILSKIMLLAASVIVLAGCDKLPLQRSYDYDGEALDPHVNMTAMEWLESRGGEFSMMVSAIRHSGLESYYTQTEQPYTFLIIKNSELRFWMTTAGYMNITDMPQERVANLLKYHIIKGRYSTYYKEAPIDPSFVKTLLDGEDGLMTLRCVKSSYPIYGAAVTSGNIMINTQRTNGSSPQRNSVSTNYITTNGVMHIMADYAYYKRDSGYPVLF